MSDFLVRRDLFDSLKHAIGVATVPEDIYELLPNGSSRQVFDVSQGSWYHQQWNSRNGGGKTLVAAARKHFVGWTQKDHDVARKMFMVLAKQQRNLCKQLEQDSEIAVRVRTPERIQLPYDFEGMRQSYADAFEVYELLLYAGDIHDKGSRFRKVLRSS